MKTDLEVEVEVDLRQLGKVIIFRYTQNLPIIYRYIVPVLQISLVVRLWTSSQPAGNHHTPPKEFIIAL